MHHAQQRNKHKPGSVKAKFDRIAERAARFQRKGRVERVRFLELEDDQLISNSK